MWLLSKRLCHYSNEIIRYILLMQTSASLPLASLVRFSQQSFMEAKNTQYTKIHCESTVKWTATKNMYELRIHYATHKRYGILISTFFHLNIKSVQQSRVLFLFSCCIIHKHIIPLFTILNKAHSLTKRFWVFFALALTDKNDNTKVYALHAAFLPPFSHITFYTSSATPWISWERKKSVFYFVLRQSIICIFSFLQAPTSFFVRAKHSIGVYPNVPPEQIGSLEWWRWSTQNSQHSMSTATAKLLYIPFTIDLTVYSQLGLKFFFFCPVSCILIYSSVLWMYTYISL